MLRLWKTPGFAAEADIEHALVHTLSTFGVQKFNDYAALIQEALEILAVNPQVGRKRHDIDSTAWTHHIGKRARSMLWCASQRALARC